MMLSLIFLILVLIFLCWGSFLNLLAFRLVTEQDFVYKRSYCISCKTNLASYDLVPFFSWILLSGKCRYCKKSISILYPIIELLTVILFLIMFYYIESIYFIAYSVYISALIITIRSDLETLLISRYATIYIIPVAFILSYLNLLPINLLTSFLGAIFGYIILWLVNKLFYLLRNKQGIGEGDFELLATIGAFTGPIGVWSSVLFGSFIGAIIGIILFLIGKLTPNTKIPFGPLLAIGSLIYLFNFLKIEFLFN